MADAPVGPEAPAPADDRKYFTAIDSVNIKHPLANIANRPGLNLDARKNADDAWDSTASREAESTVLSLKVAQRELTRFGHNIHVLTSDHWLGN